MILKNLLLNFSFLQLIKSYIHLENQINFSFFSINNFLLGFYYNLGIFKLNFIFNFFKNFCKTFINHSIRKLPFMLISDNLYITRFLKFFFEETPCNSLTFSYSFGKWTFGLFSNRQKTCKLKKNKIRWDEKCIRFLYTYPKSIIGLDDNFYTYAELKRKKLTYFNIISHIGDYVGNYYSTGNTNSNISVYYYIQFFFNLFFEGCFFSQVFFFEISKFLPLKFNLTYFLIINKYPKSFQFNRYLRVRHLLFIKNFDKLKKKLNSLKKKKKLLKIKWKK